MYGSLLDELAVCTDKDSPYLFPFLSGKKTGEAGLCGIQRRLAAL